MRFQIRSVSRAFRVLPVIGAALAFSVIAPAAPAGAFSINQIGTIGTRPVVIGPTIYYPPDLVVSGTSRVTSGDSFSTSYAVTILVRNTGQGASSLTQVSIWDRGYLPTLTVPALAAGGSMYLSYNTTRPYPSSDCTLVLHVDPSNSNAEMDEYNNNASVLLNTFTPTQC